MYTVRSSSHLSALCQLLAKPLEARMSGFMSPIERWDDKLYAPAELEYLFARSEIGYSIIAPLHGFAARDVKVDLALAGVDVNGKLMDKDNAFSRELGLSEDQACFYTSAIADYVPQVPPDIVIALHACDTATDDALALAVRQGTGLIVSVPCCHHYLNKQLQAVDPFRPVLRHGILKQRMADILTDTFRALILRIMGYKTDVIEFISSEHTDRNLMIRAVRRTNPGEAEFVREYLDLKAFWGVTPYLETLLGEDFAAYLV
jgi:hypothetical protein